MMSFSLTLVGMSERVKGVSMGYVFLVNGLEVWNWCYGYGVFKVRVFGYGFMCGRFGGMRYFNWRWLGL